MPDIQPYLPLIAPLIVLQLALMALALFDLARRERVRGSKWIWVIIVIAINLFGPLAYFLVGREE